MKVWPVQDAKAHFSELLNICLKDGPQVVSRRGLKTAVVISITEWQRLNHTTSPSLKALLLSDDLRADMVLPKRGKGKYRKPHMED